MMQVRWRKIRVTPNLPPQLSCLEEMAYNFLWSWEDAIRELFIQIAPDLWDATGRNPVRMLYSLNATRIRRLLDDPAFMASLKAAQEAYERYMKAPTWFSETHPERAGMQIAYFSMEYGLATCLPNYSGGLGILAGDHLKAASDLGLPLTGIGLLYQEGYFQQYLNADGWQQESYPHNDFYNLPVQPVAGPDGLPLKIMLDLPGRPLRLQIWRAEVGRVRLCLLDANIPENTNPEDRALTDRLYGGGPDKRLMQEIILGIGGMRALEALGLHPSVYHMNEGHSAFLALELIRRLRHEDGLSLAEAKALAANGAVFTTHTPVPAGFDLFDEGLLAAHLKPYVESVGFQWHDFLSLGQANAPGFDNRFNMAVLALRQSVIRNGVSRLHGEVSRRMFQPLWSEFPEQEVPITAVTNGIHLPTWLNPEMRKLLEEHLGADFLDRGDDPAAWDPIERIPSVLLWRIKARARERLIHNVRETVASQMARRGAPGRLVEEAAEALDPSTLTLGFARRFATYKRASLLLLNPDRLKRLLLNPDRPVQIIFAGKAHPADNQGKEFIRMIFHFAHDPEMRRRILFLENYDMDLARRLVQGVDVWVNTPRRPMEACGTSGMKVIGNGGLHLSTLDGWWAEAWEPGAGWAIGSGEEYPDPSYQDQVESDALYNLLEEEITPLFYEFNGEPFSAGWMAAVKASMRRHGPRFNAERMVREYCDTAYLPLDSQFGSLRADRTAQARSLTAWQQKILSHWDHVQIFEVGTDSADTVPTGSRIPVRAIIRLDGLDPSEVAVELYFGPVNNNHEVVGAISQRMQWKAAVGPGTHRFEGELPLDESGMTGYAVRVVPYHAAQLHMQDLARIRWAS